MDPEAREALELPAILERLAAAAATEPGALLARALEPSADEGEVRRRQELTSEAIALLDAAEEPELAGVSDVREVAARAARDGVLGAAELRAVVRTVRVALGARSSLETSTLAPALTGLATAIEPSLSRLADRLDRAVADDGSDLRDSASPLLARLRKEVASGAARIQAELARVAASSAVREALQESFLAERGGRPVLAVRASARSKVPGIVHDASSTGQTLFVEPFAVVELGNRLAEAAADAREEAERILRELSAAVAAEDAALVVLVDAAAAIDLALACGVLSRGHRGAPVAIGGAVSLTGVRHPLIDPAAAVPIDLDLGELRALVISGPNTGGKTVALKTLGLCALLHQCGVRPPADRATLPVFDQVLADIGDRQSIEMSLSTFSAHLQALVAILASATERSLVLLDEVAVGTDPEEGSALAQALVARLARQARLTAVTTHYAELKEWASATDGVANAATGFDPETHAPLYRVALGRPGTSQALRTAERLGLDPEVVADARSRVAPDRLRAGELLAEAEAADRAAAGRRDEAEGVLRDLRRREAALEQELERLRESRESARREARADAERELAEARTELDRIRADLRRARRSRRESQQDRILGGVSESVRRAERSLGDLGGPVDFAGELAVGDPVEAPELGVRGTIAAIRGSEAEVVGAAGQRVRIQLGRLRPSRERAPEERAPSVSVQAAARGDVSDQLDVRGLPAVEAREQVRRALDDAALAGLREVRIVHGRGTGALRRAVRDELAAHPLVERGESDADDGATVAHLG
jgi:DNA mismatch repair protein MutS2